MSPARLPASCRVMGCPHPQPCPRHGRAAQAQAYDRMRGSAHERGYGHRWVRYTEWYFAELWRLRVPRAGLCGSRFPGAPQTQDSECARYVRPTAARVVDHIVPVRGPDDPTFYDPHAQQALCTRCHDRKRQRESMAGRRRP